MLAQKKEEMKSTNELLQCILQNQQTAQRFWENVFEEYLLPPLQAAIDKGLRKPKANRPTVLNAVEVVKITGFQMDTARKLLRKIRTAVGKSPRSLVTVSEFCKITGISEAEVTRLLS